jgi:hypothetical protein
VILAPHPSSEASAVRSLNAQVARARGAQLHLHFRLEGELAKLRIPVPAEQVEADGLWRSTCFEAFVAERGSPAYCELNLAPSRAWALYCFEAYRKPYSNVVPGLLRRSTPAVSSTRTKDALDLSATIDLRGLIDAAATWQIGLTAVIEDSDGRLSYWSARHAPGKPDFHHRDTFAIELAA